MTDSFFNYSSGQGPQTPLGRDAIQGAVPSRDGEMGFGTDSGLQTPLDRGVSRGSTTTSGPTGTDSGLSTPVGR